ncbi:MAG: hypothetical protein QME81_18705 [bacterium]|nr:hypothetical protein [bacterium]
MKSTSGLMMRIIRLCAMDEQPTQLIKEVRKEIKRVQILSATINKSALFTPKFLQINRVI